MKTLQDLREYAIRAEAASHNDEKLYRGRREYREAHFFEGAEFAFRNMTHVINKMIEEQTQ